MLSRRRRAAINRNLIIVLIVLALGAGVFWAIKWRSGASESAETLKEFNVAGGTAKFYCPDCKKEFELSAADAMKARDKNTKLYKCPHCSKYVAKLGSAPPEADGAVVP